MIWRLSGFKENKRPSVTRMIKFEQISGTLSNGLKGKEIYQTTLKSWDLIFSIVGNLFVYKI